MNTSELIGSNVLILENAKIVGSVGGLIFNQKFGKVTHLKVLIEDDSDCEVKYASTASIYAVKQNNVCLKYAHNLSGAEARGHSCPIGLPAFDETGEVLGNITDLRLTDKWKCTELITSKKTIPQTDILTYSDELLVIKSQGSTLKLSKRKLKVPTAKKESTPKVEDNAVKILSIPNDKREHNYSFLYGRKTCEDIFALDGRLIVPNGTTINKEVVSLSRLSGVITQLVSAGKLEQSI